MGSFLYLIFVPVKLDPKDANLEDIDRSDDCTARCNAAVILAGHLNEYTRPPGMDFGGRPVDTI